MRLAVSRAGWAALVLLVVVTLSFALVRSLPGGPFDEQRALDPVIRANLMAAYDLDAPLPAQYGRYVLGLLHGDFGPSLRYRDYSVGQILAESLPISALLGTLALVIALVAGLAAGALAAARRGSWLDTVVMGAATAGIALPNFVLAGVLVLLFSFHWRLFPVAGWGSPAQLVLPSLALGLPFAASIARLFRAGLLESFGEDWIRTARAKGRSPSGVLWGHAARVALLPVVSYTGPAAAGILSGSLVVERVFAISGMGSHFVDSAFNADYNLALGVVIVYTALVSALNLLADLAYGLLDPRIEAP
ncbi:MAG TPA: ABC transporter permease [Planctomycetota bacterium]|nr:ABC transporter permease [Planctomycetota bacterium]